MYICMGEAKTMRIIDILDKDDAITNILDMGVVKRGNITQSFILKLRNNTGSTLENIVIKPGLSLKQRGRESDTIYSTFISSDNLNFYSSLTINLLGGEIKPIYLKYQPRWLADPMLYRWALNISLLEITGEILCPAD